MTVAVTSNAVTFHFGFPGNSGPPGTSLSQGGTPRRSFTTPRSKTIQWHKLSDFMNSVVQKYFASKRLHSRIPHLANCG